MIPAVSSGLNQSRDVSNVGSLVVPTDGVSTGQRPPQEFERTPDNSNSEDFIVHVNNVKPSDPNLAISVKGDKLVDLTLNGFDHINNNDATPLKEQPGMGNEYRDNESEVGIGHTGA